MKLILFAIGRLIVIAFAFFIGVTAASLFIGYGLATGMMAEFLGPEINADVVNSDIGHIAIGIATMVAAVFTSPHLFGLAALPVTLAIAATEMMRWQSMSVHLVAGGICALFALFSALPSQAAQAPNSGTLIVALAAGFVAAFFYWLIAGRNAGEWLSALGEKDAQREG